MAKPVTVTARVELTYKGKVRVPGEVFAVTPLDALTLGQAKQVSLTRHLHAAPTQKPKRKRGTYERRDMVAKP